jgi:NADH-quinone oxidoreductase subunit N
MLLNYFIFLPENYLLFSTLSIFIYLIFFSFSEEKKFPKKDIFTGYIVKLILVNFFLLSSSLFSFNFGIRDIFFKDDLSNGIQLLNIFFVFLFFLVVPSLIKRNSLSSFEFTILILLCLLSLNLLVISVNLVSFYLLLELQGICFYTLASYEKKNKYSFEAGLKYFILGSFSSVLLLFGIVLFYGFTGIFYYEDLHLFFLNLGNIESTTYLSSVFNFAIAFMLVGLLFKLYSFPFHFWVSDIYQGSPFATTFFFSFVPFFSLFYVFIKLYFYIYFFFYENFIIFLFFCSVGSMLIGSIGAIQQKKFRRLMAYSSITGTGYYLMLFIYPDLLMIKHVFFFIFVYLINIFGIFLCFSNIVLMRHKHSIERFSLLSDLLKYNKLFAFALVLFFFSIAGLPPFPSFLAKLYLLFNLFNNNSYFFIFLIIGTTVLSFYYYLRISKIILYNKDKKWTFRKNISYMDALLIMYILFFNIFLILKPSLILIPLEYFLIDLF